MRQPKRGHARVVTAGTAERGREGHRAGGGLGARRVQPRCHPARDGARLARLAQHELHRQAHRQQQECHQDGGCLQRAHARQNQNMRSADVSY